MSESVAPTSSLLHLPVFSFQGSPRQMGESFGEQCREEIHRLTDIRLRSAQQFSAEHSGKTTSKEAILNFAASCLPISESWDPETHEEFLGIARGANLEPALLYMMQGLTDIRDHLAFNLEADEEGCSSFIIERQRAKNGKILAGQTWDLQTSNMDYVILVRRRPDNAPETLSLTLTGCLSLIGLNSEGFAIGTTNLIMRDTQPGLHYLHLLHRLLRCRNVEEAAPIIQNCPRMAAHFYYMADANGHSLGVECSARNEQRVSPTQGSLIHCNHTLAPNLQPLEPVQKTDSTHFRQERLAHLIEHHPQPVGVEDLKTFLADHEGGHLSLCRHDVPPNGVSTNACVIMSPETRELHACRGQAHAGAWKRVTVG